MQPGDVAAQVLALLAQSLRLQGDARTEAEGQLTRFQDTLPSAAFLCPLLQQLMSIRDEGPDMHLRLMGCLWVKHYVKRQWKQHMGDHTRAARELLVHAALHEPVATIALHWHLTLAIIARAEFPTQWPFEQLFPPLVAALVAPSSSTSHGLTVVQQRSGQVLYRVVKELATRRLMVHRKQFAMLSVELLPLVLQFWCMTATACLSVQMHSQQTHSEDSVELGRVLLCSTKLVSCILTNAFRDVLQMQNGETVHSVLLQFYEKLEQLIAYRQHVVQTTALDDDVVAVLDKCTYRLAKMIVGVQKAYPIEFRAYLPPFLQLLWTFLASTAQDKGGVACVKLQIQALQFLTNVLGCSLYKSDSVSSSNGTGSTLITKVITASGDVTLTQEMVTEAQTHVHGFLSSPSMYAHDPQQHSSSRFDDVVRLVVLSYMRLTPDDLADWKSDSEAYIMRSETLTAEESVRTGAENLFLTLLQTFPSQTTPVLTALTQAVSSWCQELGQVKQGPLDRLLEIDAVLLAIGLGCYDLHDCFEFEPWFLANLVRILVDPQIASCGSYESVPVLPYRVVWLVSCWLAQLSASIRPSLYEVLLNPVAFFQPDEVDTAFKLRVVQTIDALVNDWGFEAEVFVPFLGRALQCLFTFFPQTEESESKLKVLGCLETIVNVCPRAPILEHCELISAPLPAMWSSGTSADSLVRGKILQLLVALLTSVAPEKDLTTSAMVESEGASKLIAMCCEVVGFATDVDNPEEVYLMENGLDVWLHVLQISHTYTEPVHKLFANCCRLMNRDNEHAVMVMQIIDEYVRLGDVIFWREYNNQVTMIMENLLGNVKPEACIQIAATCEHLVAKFTSNDLVGCAGVATYLISSCVSYARKVADKEPERVIVAYLHIIARLMLHHMEFLGAHVLGNDMSVLVLVMELMVDQFFATTSCSVSLTKRKLWATALCSTLTTLDASGLTLTGQIIEACADVIDLEHEHQQSHESVSPDDHGFRAFRSHQKKKQEQIEDNDIRQLDLKALVCTQLNQVATKLGADAFALLLQTVDSSVQSKFS